MSRLRVDCEVVAALGSDPLAFALLTKWGLPHWCVRTVVSRSYRADNAVVSLAVAIRSLTLFLLVALRVRRGLLLSVIEHSVILRAKRW